MARIALKTMTGFSDAAEKNRKVSLDKIGNRHNTDKAKIMKKDKRGNTRPSHNYLESYEKFLDKFRHKPKLRIMELGAGPDWNCGASAYM